jgi:inosine-uridine nucleoside N-ribohydrolase
MFRFRTVKSLLPICVQGRSMIMLRFLLSLTVVGCLGSFLRAQTSSADEYRLRRETVQKAATAGRRVPTIPPKEQKLRVIIDADAHNEIDDVWAIALALLSPERFQIEGFVAANYDNANEGAGPESIATSADTIRTLLGKAGLDGKFPVKLGAPPLRYQFEPSESEGVDFIIEKAMASTPEDPLWIIGLGAATDLASAYLKEPRIVDRVVVFWHGRTEWPNKANNFNVHGDVRAARILFHSNLPFVLFDTGSRLFCPMEESAQWVKQSELGRFLHEYRLKNEWYQSPTKGFYDLGDIAALVDPSLATWETVACPEVAWDLTYRFRNTMGRIVRCADIDRDRTFALLDRKLAESARPATTAAQPARVIFDTDVGGDIDDAGALAVLHALANRGEVELLAMGVVNGHELAVPYVDAVNTWYGRPDVPIGTIKDGAPFARDRYMAPIVASYPHNLTKAEASDVVTLYRKVLAAQPDRSVTFVVVGPPTNISRLLDSPPDDISPLNGAELVRRKVKFYGAGGNGDGKLPHGKPGFNYQMDVPAARNELEKMPDDVPMVFAGGSGWKLEVGDAYRGATAGHIVRRSFEAYFNGAEKLDRPSWDELRVLYACRPAAREKFETSPGGEIAMDAQNFIHWSAEPRRNRAYAYVKDRDAVRAELTELMLEGPGRANRHR